MSTSFYWHDYETFGTDPQRDLACQFAGMRTDMDFNPVGEPLVIYCKPSPDYLPHPVASLITGITPQHALTHGLAEAEFIRQIHAQLAVAGTCSLGYNTLRFDDEVTRNLLYRNFFDPYAREWQQQNSRWDLIDVARAAQALRPDGIHWPQDETGTPSFRLENLTSANGISHAAAHDALSDVLATIALARLIKHKQPKLFDYLFENRHKTAVLQLLKVGSFTPLVHVSGRYAAKHNCLAVITALCSHPSNNNETIVYDLSIDPTPLLSLSAEEIRQRVFVANSDLAAETSRIPLRTVRHNRCPVLAPLNVIRAADAERLQLDLAKCQQHLQQIKAAPDLSAKLQQVFSREFAETPNDPDLMIYSGGFFNSYDKTAIDTVRNLGPQPLKNHRPAFDDKRLPEMLFRYRARNFPETLSAEERQDWLQFCHERLHTPNDVRRLDFKQYFALIAELKTQADVDLQVLEQLQAYGETLLANCECSFFAPPPQAG